VEVIDDVPGEVAEQPVVVEDPGLDHIPARRVAEKLWPSNLIEASSPDWEIDTSYPL
jgi:hypothetical protein